MTLLSSCLIFVDLTCKTMKLGDPTIDLAACKDIKASMYCKEAVDICIEAAFNSNDTSSKYSERAKKCTDKFNPGE